ncbi:hypothetical protein KSP40_PGU005701 [Platanthera guangdongensis]|uniref:Uncharacterized protein n=1 Tax=Platanthera guangdongensis TaxID=2320717 RepID=A0ABR2LG17_9ASPA
MFNFKEVDALFSCLQLVIRKHPSRDTKVHIFWFSLFGVIYNLIAFCNTDLDRVIFIGFFHGYSSITIYLIFAQAFSGITVIMILKYADNIVKDCGYVIISLQNFECISQLIGTESEYRGVVIVKKLVVSRALPKKYPHLLSRVSCRVKGLPGLLVGVLFAFKGDPLGGYDGGGALAGGRAQDGLQGGDGEDLPFG